MAGKGGSEDRRQRLGQALRNNLRLRKQADRDADGAMPRRVDRLEPKDPEDGNLADLRKPSR